MAKTLSRTVTIYVNGTQVQSTIKSLNNEMNKIKAQQKLMAIGSQEYGDAGLKIKEIKSVLKGQDDAIRQTSADWDDLRKKAADFSNVIMGLLSVIQMGDAAIGSIKDLANDAAALDDVYADVMKTMGADAR